MRDFPFPTDEVIHVNKSIPTKKTRLQSILIPLGKIVTGAFMLGAISVSNVNADTLSLNAVTSGHYNLYGGISTSPNTATYMGSYRSWIGWDLSGVTGIISSATISVFSDSNNAGNATITLYDVTTPFSDLGAVADASIYTDLGTGNEYGTGNPIPGQFNTFSLTSAAIADINSADTYFVVGARSNAANFNYGYNNGVGTNPAYYKLDLVMSPAVVPLPAALPLFGSALGFMGFIATRRRKAA